MAMKNEDNEEKEFKIQRMTISQLATWYKVNVRTMRRYVKKVPNLTPRKGHWYTREQVKEIVEYWGWPLFAIGALCVKVCKMTLQRIIPDHDHESHANVTLVDNQSADVANVHTPVPDVTDTQQAQPQALAGFGAPIMSALVVLLSLWRRGRKPVTPALIIDDTVPLTRSELYLKQLVRYGKLSLCISFFYLAYTIGKVIFKVQQ
jgi:hypothetical protein